MGTVVGVKQDPKASALDAQMFRIARQSSEEPFLTSIQRGRGARNISFPHKGNVFFSCFRTLRPAFLKNGTGNDWLVTLWAILGNRKRGWEWGSKLPPEYMAKTAVTKS